MVGGNLKIELKWDKPIRLKDGSKLFQFYAIPSPRLERIPNRPGVYVFARSFGQSIAPLYIGQTSKLRSRINDHLKSSGRLMMKIKRAQAGRRILLVASLKLHPGQREEKVLEIVEKALIKHALAGGFELLNKQGVKTRVHVIKSKGNTSSKQVAPLRMLAEKK
jgi:hypothetical protein